MGWLPVGQRNNAEEVQGLSRKEKIVTTVDHNSQIFPGFDEFEQELQNRIGSETTAPCRVASRHVYRDQVADESVDVVDLAAH